ncbi:MAG: hypothetical protein L3J46_09050, partial [Kangiellaceae bacterium]|nr:hypothetical protein [Kangiellaceae bacterium]
MKTITENRIKNLTKSLLIGAISGLALAGFSAYAADYSRVEKELRIMSKIFETSMGDAKRSDRRSLFPGRSSGAEAIYLAKQGMVFSFNFSSSRFGGATEWQVFGEGVGHLVGSISRGIGEALSDIDIEAPTSPTPPVLPENMFEDWGNAWEENMEAYEDYHEAMDDLKEQNRTYREQVRSLQRAIRGIERQSRHDQNDTEKLTKNKIELEDKITKLNEKMKVYEKSMQDYREKRKEKYRINNRNKADAIVSTLCDYGATLRSLKNNEYITLIFKNYQDSKNQVHVFSYNDVKDCSSKD